MALQRRKQVKNKVRTRTRRKNRRTKTNSLRLKRTIKGKGRAGGALFVGGGAARRNAAFRGDGALTSGRKKLKTGKKTGPKERGGHHRRGSCGSYLMLSQGGVVQKKCKRKNIHKKKGLLP